MTANAADRLMQHYVDKFRRLPWRSPPGQRAPDPYRVWLSEVMLQQTTVAAVAPRFERFVALFPTIDALASARDEDILAEWAGLGYYARARNLIACAREVAARGGFPTTAAELRTLPGIGAYTSAAIAAIAFGEKAAAVDTNVKRVIARLHGLEQPRGDAVEQRVLAMIPPDGPGDFVQALIDLGATVCRPRRPRCDECPLRSDCAAFASAEPERFPAAKAGRQRPRRFGTAWWIERDSRIWLVRRPARGLLGGMAALPGSAWTDQALPAPHGFGILRHVFTHFSLDLAVAPCPEPAGEGWWQPLDLIADAGLPTLYRRAVELAMKARPAARAAA